MKCFSWSLMPQWSEQVKTVNDTGDTKKRELLKNPTKIEEIQEKTFIDRN